MVEQWVAMWQNIRDESHKEEKREIEMAEESVKKMGLEVGDDRDSGTMASSKFERMVVAGILRSVVEQLDEARRGLEDIIKSVEETVDDDVLAKAIDTKLVVKASVEDMRWQSIRASQQMDPNEWINVALGKIVQHMEKTKFQSMNALVKLILFKLIPYDLCFPKPTRMGGVGDVESDVPEPEAAPVPPAGVAPPPTPSTAHAPDAPIVTGKMSKLSVGKYVIKSRVFTVRGKEKRL